MPASISFQILNKVMEAHRTPARWITDGLKALETACLAQNANHKDWHCTEEMMAQTNGGDALYMHCLPADITGVSCAEAESAKRSSKNTASPPIKKRAGSRTSSLPR